MTASILKHPDATITIEELNTGRRKITIVPINHNLFISKNTWETSYPISLIKQILTAKGPGWVCDEIMRDEDPNYVQRNLELSILAYVGEELFENARILDFGCGSGASSMVLNRLFPSAELVGVDLMEEYVSIARKRAEHYGFENATFLVSADGKSLPDNLGEFDVVVLSAVFEHLLPDERTTALPLVWDHLKSGGILFLNETPFRFFPFESHTTRLPLINYCPDRLALFLARRLSKKVDPNINWETLLRQGIRGGTVKQIVAILKQTPRKPVLLRPNRLGIEDRVDLWLRSTGAMPSFSRRSAFIALKSLKYITGFELVPYLSLAIRKE